MQNIRFGQKLYFYNGKTKSWDTMEVDYIQEKCFSGYYKGEWYNISNDAIGKTVFTELPTVSAKSSCKLDTKPPMTESTVCSSAPKNISSESNSILEKRKDYNRMDDDEKRLFRTGCLPWIIMASIIFIVFPIVSNLFKSSRADSHETVNQNANYSVVSTVQSREYSFTELINNYFSERELISYISNSYEKDEIIVQFNESKNRSHHYRKVEINNPEDLEISDLFWYFDTDEAFDYLTENWDLDELIDEMYS